MDRIVACLGYTLQDGKVPPILENRLRDCARLCKKYPHATLLLMGHAPYHHGRATISEARAMSDHIEKYYPWIVTSTKIILEEKTTSTVEQICFLRKYAGSRRIVIVASKYFSRRVRWYVRYILQETADVQIISSKVPRGIERKLAVLESEKLQKTKPWLRRHKKGDWRAILQEQGEFQEDVKQGRVVAPGIAL